MEKKGPEAGGLEGSKRKSPDAFCLAWDLLSSALRSILGVTVTRGRFRFEDNAGGIRVTIPGQYN